MKDLNFLIFFLLSHDYRELSLVVDGMNVHPCV